MTPITLADLEFLGVDRCYRHTAHRFLTRFGVRLDAGDYLRLCSELAQYLPTLHPLLCAGTRCRVWYRVAGKLVEMVYDWRSHVVITVLTPPAPKRRGNTRPLESGSRSRHALSRRTYCRRGKHRVRWEEDL